MKNNIPYDLEFDLKLGEGQFIEFKDSLDKSLSKEMVAFANASGGIVYLGINDAGQKKGIEITNRLKSQIQDMARNCDPPIIIVTTEINDACNRNNNSCNLGFSDTFWVTIGSNFTTIPGNFTEDFTEDFTDNFTENESRLNKILMCISNNKRVTTTELANVFNVSKRTILSDMALLKDKSIIRRIGLAKGGHWEIIK